ncbi:autotransporter-associated beta strand repeat-containing protein [Sphingomonas sp. CROZ-RG-20F-R02-07]|uniref:autotransporter-associated beta strand repeat-containing protein n=1 Tax=Sphingomonas sp. CROZ-RG-20F-R02-07 TaxID=2914832 RepID=UPI001F5689CC|nr:autotransporter-associated beta strand repeat-containing protein [Sphingomonas sp. CROZ-RG-20F-R02-07]
MVSIGTAVRMRSSVRNMALLGSALGSTLVVQPAAAQNQSFTGPTNYQNGGTISGGPTTVSATTATGDISLDLDTVIAANPGSGTATPGTNAAIYAANSGTGNVNIKDVNATITGTGASNGIFASAQGGTVAITQTGKVDATNAANGRGIAVVTNGGTITINANEADGGLRGIYTGTTGGTAALASLTTINVVTAQSTGAANQPNAIIAQGDRVILNSGTASLTNSAGTNGTAIFVNAGTSAVVTAGTTNAFGQGQAGIIAAADGTLDLTSGTVHTTQNSDGISIQGGNAITVRSGTIQLDGANSGYALVLGGNEGGNFTSGPNGIGYASANVTSGSITSAGANTSGIYATPNGAGTTAITSGTITMTGANATAINVRPIGTGVMTGATTIASTTINASGTGASGIVVASGNTTAPVSITSGTIAVTNGTGISVTAGPTTIASTEIDTNNGSGIVVQGAGLATVTSGLVKNMGTGNAQAISVQSDAVNLTSNSITGGGSGISVSANGTADTTIASGSMALTAVASSRATSLNGIGLSAIEAGTGNLAITSGSLVYTGTGNTFGIQGQAVGGGNLTITSGTVSAIGNGGYAILGLTSSGALSITSTGNVTTVGTTRAAAGQTDAASQRYANGIDAFSLTGAVSVTNSGTISTAGTTARGIDVEAGRAKTTFGAPGTTASTAALSVNNTGTVTTGGATANAINVASDANTLTIASNAVSTSGAGSVGINVGASTGANTITSTSATTSGTGANAINIVSTTGAINLTSTTASTSGVGSQAIYAQTTDGNITINAGTTTTTATGTGAGGMTSDGVIGYASGAGAVTIVSGTASTAGYNANAVLGTGGGAVSITAGTTSTTGGQVSSIYGRSRTADLTINAGTTTATGQNSYAVEGHANTGNLSITSGTVSAALGNAIFGDAGGKVTVNATTANASGDGGAGVYVTGGTGVTLNIGSASSTGTIATNASTGQVYRADAIYAAATTGTINAVVGSASARGANADAIHLIANGTGGGVTLAVNGAVSSAGGYGVFIDPPGANSVTVASGASVSGAVAGIDAVGATNSIVNLGSVSSSGGPGILASGTTTLDNSGAIAGANGIAVQLGATNDTVILRTGSAITGTVAGGGGTDAAVLIGTSGRATATQQVANFSGFDNLTVQSGYWTAPPTGTTAVNATTIASGAAFEVANGTTGIAGYTSSTYADNGTLVVRSGTASGGSTFGAATVMGTGGVLFTGTGTATLDGTNSLRNTGTNTVDAGSTLLVTGTQGGTFVNNGTVQVGTGGNFTGTLADNGTLISSRSDSYTFAGALTGSGTFVKQGAGSVVFGSNYGFTGTTVLNGGSIRLSTPVAASTMLDAEGTGTYDLSGNTQTIAQLSGASTGATVNIANGALTVNQAGNTSFAGSITGNGSLTKSGAGSLNLTGTNTYAGPTTITGGRLAVNGSITSPVTVFMGGTLGGNGTVGSTTVASGGIFAPGNSIGTLNVAGNVAFAAGSIYQVEANAAGQADRTNVTGTATLSGGTVQVLAASGVYAPLTSYTILTAAGGVTGQFAGATSNLAFLTPALTYGANAVTLSLGRNDISFASQATAPNGVAVANAVAARGLGDTVYNAVLVQTANGAGQAFNRLSGEIHATIPTAMIDSDRRVRDAILDRARVAQGDGLGLWMQGLDTYAYSRDQAQAFGFHTNRIGVYGGIDYAVAGFRIGVSGGYFDDKLRVPALASRADIETDLIGGSISYAALGGRLNATAGVTQAWHHVDTTRTVDVPGLAGAYIAAYEIRTTQAFGELGFALLQGPVSLTPFVRYDYDRSRADGFAEIGGPAALNVAAERRHNEFGTAGARIAASYPIGGDLVIEPHASAAYLRTWDRLYSTRLETFGGTGPAFGVTGDRLGRDNLDASGGIDLIVSTHIRIGATGYVMRSSEWRDYGGKGSVSVRF